MTLSLRLRHDFGGFDLDVDVGVPAGVTALFGRSGAGKTTVVNAVAGLLKPQAGRIAVDDRVLLDTERGVCLPPHKRRLGYVFQEGRLFPHMDVRRNLTYGRRFAPEPASHAEVGRVIDLLGLGDLLDRRPGALSGGEKQRVAIGRALLAGPSLILADEPLASLDEVRKAEILPYFERIRDEARLPILYVSHSVTEVARLATTVIMLEGGRVVRTGTAAEVLSDPASVPFLGVREAGALIEGRVAVHHRDGLTEVAVSGGRLFLPGETAAPGAAVRIRISAQDVILSRSEPQGLSALNILKGEITAVRSGTGPGVIVRLRIGDDHLLARVTKRSAVALGLEAGADCYAIIKSVSIAPSEIGHGGG